MAQNFSVLDYHRFWLVNPRNRTLTHFADHHSGFFPQPRPYVIPAAEAGNAPVLSVEQCRERNDDLPRRKGKQLTDLERLQCRLAGIQRSHIASAMLVHTMLNQIPQHKARTIYHVKHGLISDYDDTATQKSNYSDDSCAKPKLITQTFIDERQHK